MHTRRKFRSLFVFLCLLAATPSNGWSSEEINSPKSFGEFSIGKEGRPILLPVEVSGDKFLFLVDTGARRCAFDINLKNILGKHLGRKLLQTPAGQSSVETYEWPDATLNHLPLKTEEFVLCIDLTQLREAINEPIYGVIGMDVLRACRLQIDFDGGLICFLNSLPDHPDKFGTRIPIELSSDGTPRLLGVFAMGLSEGFLIDTGAQGNALRPELFDQLRKEKLIRLGGTFNSITVNGEVMGDRGMLRDLSVGSVTHDELRMARVRPSALGLRYLSRYLVTLDFPGRSVYLREGAHFSKREPHASSGMSLRWLESEITVASVKERSPADNAGVRTNDVLARIDGKPAAEFDHFSLRQLLTSDGGRRVPIRIRRNGMETEIEITLESE